MHTNRIVYCADVIARFESLSGPFVLVERLGSVPGLALPGGKQDPGETLSRTAVRECLEETGLTLTLLETLETRAEPERDPRGTYVSTVFLGIAHGTPRDEFGKTRVRFLSEEEIREHHQTFVLDHYTCLETYLQTTETSHASPEERARPTRLE